MITAGYLARHAGPARGARDVALLDVCQDYALDYLNMLSVFEFGVVLKGGTSLRKFRAGNAGRFSTDLDFATPDADTAEFVINCLDGAKHHEVRMHVESREALRGVIRFETPLGEPTVAAKLELSSRPLWLPTQRVAPIPLPVHKAYEFVLPNLPVPAIEEAIAEKLAAWRRRRKMRDLYDLFWFGQGALNEVLVRRLFVLKVWNDVVRDGLGDAPLDPAEVVADVDYRRLPQEDIGLLTQPVDPKAWLQFVRQRYAFVVDFDQDEHRVARCSLGDDFFVQQLVKEL
jgi:predicted nucleotidyltransferase component of viral defense system